MQSGRNSTRRNRNIGTAKQGHGQDNRLVIPETRSDRNCFELIGKFEHTQALVSGETVDFYVEKNSGGCIHPCSIGDLTTVLSAVPASDWAGLDTFVLRQPTRKQRVINPVWGRLQYHAMLTSNTGKLLKRGPAIFLEAVDVRVPIVWSTSLGPDDAQELDRLRSDGHRVSRAGKKFTLAVTPETARATQLYRTILHELGHWFDWLEKVEGPSMAGEDFDELLESYFERPSSEREAFAHRYADRLSQRFSDKKVIPFDQSSGVNL